jgi:hypothetical protein
LVPQRDRPRQIVISIGHEEFRMTSLVTLALGLVFFGLFFAMVAACDHL